MLRWFWITLLTCVIAISTTMAWEESTEIPITTQNVDQLTRVGHINTGDMYSRVKWIPGSPSKFMVLHDDNFQIYGLTSDEPLYTIELASEERYSSQVSNAVIIMGEDPIFWDKDVTEGSYRRWNLNTGEELPTVNPWSEGWEGIEEFDRFDENLDNYEEDLRKIYGKPVLVIETREQSDYENHQAILNVGYWDLTDGQLLARYTSDSYDWWLSIPEEILPDWKHHFTRIPVEGDEMGAELAIVDNESGEVVGSHLFEPAHIRDLRFSIDGEIFAVFDEYTGVHLFDTETFTELAVLPFNGSGYINTEDFLRRIPETDLILLPGGGWDSDTPTWSLLDITTGETTPLSFGIWNAFVVNESSNELEPIELELFNDVQEYDFVFGPAADKVAYYISEGPFYQHDLMNENGEYLIAESSIFISDTDGTFIARRLQSEVGYFEIFSPDDQLLVTYKNDWEIRNDGFIAFLDTANGETLAQFELEVVPKPENVTSTSDDLAARNFQFSPDGSALLFTYGGTGCCAAEYGDVIVEWWYIPPTD